MARLRPGYPPPRPPRSPPALRLPSLPLPPPRLPTLVLLPLASPFLPLASPLESGGSVACEVAAQNPNEIKEQRLHNVTYQTSMLGLTQQNVVLLAHLVRAKNVPKRGA